MPMSFSFSQLLLVSTSYIAEEIVRTLVGSIGLFISVPLTTFIASYSSPEGLFWAKLSAASTLAIAPILVLGWFSQKQLVRGLTFGAVK